MTNTINSRWFWQAMWASLFSLLAIPALSTQREVPLRYPTIANALFSALPNDTILLDSGCYREQVFIPTDVTITSHWVFSNDTNDIYQVEWMPDTGKLITVNNRILQLIGICFRADSTPIWDCGVLRGDSSNVTMTQCRILGTFDSTWNDVSSVIHLFHSDLHVNKSLFNGQDFGSSRAIAIRNSGTVWLYQCSFLGRRASRDVTNVSSHGSLYVNSCYFDHGGAGVSAGFIDGVMDIRQSRFTHTSGYTFSLGGEPVIVTDCIFDSIIAPIPEVMIGNTANGDSVKFSRCVFQNYLSNPSAVMYYGGTPLVLSNCQFRNNQTSVLFLTNHLYADSCRFGFPDAPIAMGYTQSPDIHFQNCDFSVNSTPVLSGQWTPDTVFAPNCYWGDPTGPNHPQNPGGMGTFLPSYVNPFPFRTTPVFPENGVNDPGTVFYSLPNSTELLPPYPNPFNNETVIRFSLPRSTDAAVAVYDVTGREVAALANGWLPAGDNVLRWNPTRLSSGSYYVRLSTPTGQFTRTLTYLK